MTHERRAAFSIIHWLLCVRVWPSITHEIPSGEPVFVYFLRQQLRSCLFYIEFVSLMKCLHSISLCTHESQYFFRWSLLNSTSDGELLPRTNAIAHTELALLTHPPKMFGFSDFCSFEVLASLRRDTPGVDLCPLRSVSKARLKHGAEWEKIILYVNASECTHISHFRVLRNESIPFYQKKATENCFFFSPFRVSRLTAFHITKKNIVWI